MNNVTITDLVHYQDYEYLSIVLEETLKQQDALSSVFSVILVSSDEIKYINKEYRCKDVVTDVISFALEDNEVSPHEEIRVLGDIYICIDRMKEQAQLYGHSEKRELSFLAVHGLLHLLGYDHMEEKDEKVMNSLQEKILESVGINR